MGIFKDLFRDISESRLSQRELYIKRAQGKEAEGEWESAGHRYRDAGEWERAGDAFMRSWKRKQGAYNLSPQYAAQCYYEGRNYSKMREAYLEVFSAGATTGADEKDDIPKLKRAGELENFMKAVLSAYPGPDIPKIEGYHYEDAIHVFTLFSALHEAKEASHAAELFLHYRGALFHMRDDAVRGLLQAGKIQKAIEVCLFLAKEKSLDGGSYYNLIKVFLDVEAYEGARELCVAYFALEPNESVLAFAKAGLKDSGQWKAFLEDLLKQSPLELGKALRSLGHFKKKQVGEMEADLLLRCYEAVGPRKYKRPGWSDEQVTTEWLDTLIEFWQKKGDEAKADELSFRHWEDRKRLEGTGPDQHAEEAYKFADKQEFSKAAEAMEKAAATESQDEYSGGFLYQAAKLHERAGNSDEAANLYDRLGRPAKANKVRGKRAFDLDETKPFVEMFIFDSDYWQKDLLEAAQSSDLLLKTHTIVQLLQAPMKKQEGQTWGDWTVVPALYSAAKSRTDIKGYIAALRQVETKYRDRGRWVFAAKIYLFGGFFDEFDRICQEEDELEVAALWYDKAKMPERAAKIYDLMGQSGTFGKAQSKGSKQKPQDVAQPKPDSAEEAKVDNFDQLVCPQCGAEVKPHWTACPKCDADLQQRKCKNCGEPLETGWTKCPVCKTPI